MQLTKKFSKAHIIIVTTGVLAFTSTFAYLNSLDEKIMVAKLNHDVVAGQVITSKDVKYIPVSNDEELSKILISKKALDKTPVVSRIDLTKSDILTNSNTARRSTKDGLQSLSIKLEIGRANGGDILVGDRVDIYSTGDEGRLIAKELEVRSVIRPSERLGISTSSEITIVVSVNSVQAVDLSKVVGSQDIMIVLSTGSSSKEKTKTSTPDASSTTTSLPPTDSDGFTPVDLTTVPGG